MPWLYWSLKPKQRLWAEEWQQALQTHLAEMETVTITGDVFIAPSAKLFAERGRPISIKDGSFIGANAVLHGPIEIGKNVGINHNTTMDGGKAGINIEDECRIAAYCSLIAFNHRYQCESVISKQGVNSEGIQLGKDVWLGTHVGITDGVTIGDGAIIGMRSVVTKNIDAATVQAGNPAQFIKMR